MTTDEARPDLWATVIETYREIEADTWLSAELRATCREHRLALEAEATIDWSRER